MTAMIKINRHWRAACGGLEVPFTYGRVRWLYVFDGARHGYLNMDEDIVYKDYRDGHREIVD